MSVRVSWNSVPVGKKAVTLSGIWIVLSILIGIVLSMITVGGMKAKLRTVRAQTEADSYVRDGSMNITDSSSPEMIRAVFNCSKKDFKKTLGFLYKAKKIVITPTAVTLPK